MWAYFVGRLAIAVPTLFIVTIIVFGLQHLLPGDPALALLGEDRSPEAYEQVRRQYNLDKPVVVQYGLWIGGALTGDLGVSLRTRTPVADLIVEKLPVTVQLAFMAMAIALLIGIPTGILSAVRKNSFWDYAASVLGLSGQSVPTFWLGIMLILLFSVRWGVLPASGYVSPLEDLGENLRAMIMPAFVLGAALAAVMMRHTRGAMLSVLRSDYVRTARAKGLAERRVVLRHALRNALIPIITLGALQLGQLLSGAVLTEQVFTIPGFGKLIVDAVFNRDYAVVQGVVLVTATAYIGLNLMADMAYFLVNPRLRG